MDRPVPTDPERHRLEETAARSALWDHWGPYLAERQWGTVREDYSPDGSVWTSFPHDHARSRAYRWGEDGLLGICDDGGRLCFALALWNGADPILKERLFGLTGPEGNHGEDVKELYHYLDATPSHAYLKALYRYPQRAFPYEQLVIENARRTRDDPEYELVDTGIFADDRFFDVAIEYAKASADDILIRIRVTNRGPETASLVLLPTLWFRNTWTWGRHRTRPTLAAAGAVDGGIAVQASHPQLGEYHLVADGAPTLLFTDNETNTERLWSVANAAPFVKDGIGAAVVDGVASAVNPAGTGTKVAARYDLNVASGATETVLLRLAKGEPRGPGREAAAVFAARIREAHTFYATLANGTLDDDEALVQRRAFAGLIWCKQWYHYDVAEWLVGDPASGPPSEARLHGRNSDWRELDNDDVLSMPDSWEYPWYASWDLAFHCLPLAVLDPAFAKRQLLTLTREWYMHPNGQLPAYEWSFSDVNPPVHAWAAGASTRSTNASAAWPIVISSSASSTSCWSTSRGGSTARTTTVTTSSRVASSGSTTSASSIAALRCRSRVISARPMARPGWGCTRSTCWSSPSSWPSRTRRTRTSRPSSSSTSCTSPALSTGSVSRRCRCGTTRTTSSTTALHLEDGQFIPLKVRSVVGLIPLLAVETLEPDLLERMPGLPPPAPLVPGQSPGAVRPRGVAGRTRGWASDGCWRWSTVIG